MATYNKSERKLRAATMAAGGPSVPYVNKPTLGLTPGTKALPQQSLGMRPLARKKNLISGTQTTTRNRKLK